MSIDVVVVGCGPVGVMAALLCVQRGLSVLAIDRSTEVFPLPRAIGMDDEVQRLFQDVGLEDTLREVSTPLRGAEFVDRAGKRLVGIDLPEGTLAPSGHPFMTMFDQPGLERGLRAAARDTGVEFALGVEARAVEVAAEGVRVQVAAADGTESDLAARWLIGADGASSTVRKLTGIAFEDQGFDQEWLVVDTTVLDPEMALPSIAQQVCDPDRVVSFVPGHGTRRRWEIRLNEGESADEMLDAARIAELLAPWGTPEQLRIDRQAVYRFHALVAERFRAGRVFLAGDAAHQMPPFNGQGMNSGMRDAANLVWKLALVAEGRAGDALLDSYDIERRPHAAAQVQHSADVGRLIDALARGADTSTEAGYGGGRPFPHLEAGFVFGDHPAVGHPLPQPTVDGIRLDDLLGTGFALLGNGSCAADETNQVWDRLGARRLAIEDPVIDRLRPDGETVVVRPDRYVAAVTADLDALTPSLQEVLA